jgi:flagellar protein FliO/FliZ
MTQMLLLLLLLIVIVAAAWLAWRYFGSGGQLFGGAKDLRIGLSEVATVDGKRKLLLIYRDGIEHLVMTGGPIDVVIEQGIQPPSRHQPTANTMQAAHPSYEPRLAAPSMPAAPRATAEDQPPGFGRLRQRGASQAPAPEPYGRSDGQTVVSGGGSR